ncbi:MAG: fluoride exporter [Actinomycetota bacterium]|nr:fluoride exporter [Actinomycetota bacterium]
MDSHPDEIQPEQPRAKPEWRPGVLAAVAAGGALGAPARYGIALAVTVTPGTFPWGTFWINNSGSFGLGFVLAVLLARFPADPHLRPFLATGFLGAYTTYSTFAVETDLLLRNGHIGVALAYAGASLGTGLAAAAGGLMLGRAVAGRARPEPV